MQRPRRKIRTKIGLVCFGIVLGLSLGELSARLIGFRYRPHMQNRVYFTEPDPVRGWRNRASVSGPYGQDEFLTWVSMNSLGQRGGPRTLERAGERARIAILGDSQTWGDGVADHETFAHLLDSDRFDVLNFGVMGYGTDQALLQYVVEAAAFDPDVVVITAFLGNDLRDNLSTGSFQFPKPVFRIDSSGELCLEGVPVRHSTLLAAAVNVYRFALRHSHLLNAFAEIWTPPSPEPVRGYRSWVERGRPMRPVFQADSGDPTPDALEITARLLEDLSRTVRATGASPIVVLLPDVWQIEVALDPEWQSDLDRSSVDWRRPQNVLRRRLEAMSVPVLSMLQPLARSEAAGDPIYYPRWRHLTASGHRVVARELERQLATLPLTTTPSRRSDLPSAPTLASFRPCAGPRSR